MYGFVQLCFTIIALAVFLPTYFHYPLALLYQVSDSVCFAGFLHLKCCMLDLNV